MKIIGGKYKGRSLTSSQNVALRPTSTRLREVVFNLLINAKKSAFPIESILFLDVCCGTGAVGIEALSRGCLKATFIDINTTLAKKNIQLLSLSTDQISIYQIDSQKLFNGPDKHHVCYIDPPYNLVNIENILTQLKQKSWLHDQALCFIEHSSKTLIHHIDNFEFLEKRKYGSSNLTLLQYHI